MIFSWIHEKFIFKNLLFFWCIWCCCIKTIYLCILLCTISSSHLKSNKFFKKRSHGLRCVCEKLVHQKKQLTPRVGLVSGWTAQRSLTTVLQSTQELEAYCCCCCWRIGEKGGGRSSSSTALHYIKAGGSSRKRNQASTAAAALTKKVPALKQCLCLRVVPWTTQSEGKKACTMQL